MTSGTILARVAVVAALFLSACQTPSEDVPPATICISGFEWEEWRADVEKNNDNTIIKTLPKLGREMFAAVYNKLPPSSNINPDEIVFLYSMSTLPQAAFIFIQDGCVRLTSSGNLNIMQGMMRGRHPLLRQDNLYQKKNDHPPGAV